MKSFVFKILLASFPILVIAGVYFYNDPFKVLYHYQSYFPADGVQPVVLNKDYVSMETFLNNFPEYKYDSYIFGNSRSMYYHVDEWEKHINSKNCYHFDASGESLYGIERKFQFLYDKGAPIKNALIVFDESVCVNTKNGAQINISKKHPLLSGQKRTDFQMDFLKAFFDIEFLKTYVPFLFTHRIDEVMVKKLVLDNVPIHYDFRTNEVSYPNYEVLIARNKDSFYQARSNVFYQRDSIQHYAPPTIGAEQKKMFLNIKRILDANKTVYKLVINPNYDQVKFNAEDLEFLYSVFGRGNVFDFSGINEITQTMYNYYENSHYRPFIANQIMDSIYAENPNQQQVKFK